MNDNKSGTVELVKTVIYAGLLALFVRSAFFEPFSIPSGSMIPSLLVGDYLFVSKYTYGYSRHSLPLSLPLIKNRIFYDEPERGDIVVFKLPTDNSTDYIKRLIGLPGDTVQMKKGILYINGKALPRRDDGNYVTRDSAGYGVSLHQYVETLPEGLEHVIIERSDNEPFDNTQEFKVPEGYFFFMGDNRDNSSDSRSVAVGLVPTVNLVGKARMIFFSIDGSQFSWYEFWKWPSAIRWGRMLQSIH